MEVIRKTGQDSRENRTFLPSKRILNVSKKKNVKCYVCDRISVAFDSSTKQQNTGKIFKYGNHAFALKIKLVSKILRTIIVLKIIFIL